MDGSVGGWTGDREERWELGLTEGRLEDEWSDEWRGRTKTAGWMERGIEGRLEKCWAGWRARRAVFWLRWVFFVARGLPLFQLVGLAARSMWDPPACNARKSFFSWPGDF